MSSTDISGTVHLRVDICVPRLYYILLEYTCVRNVRAPTEELSVAAAAAAAWAHGAELCLSVMI